MANEGTAVGHRLGRAWELMKIWDHVERRVTERVRSPCVDHLLGFWVPIEIRGRSLVRWKALVKAYMPVRKLFFEKIFLEENFI